MELPINPFKRALLARKLQVGLWSALGSAVCAELCAAADFDWMLIDGEHGPNDVLSVLAQLQAVAPYRTHPVVRLPGGDPVAIKRYLDIGAQTLMIPAVETAEEARILVEAVAYAPSGMRGLATMTRAARWSRVPDYVKRARDEICLIPQIETTRGIENVDAIAGMDGIDAVFVGPADLAATMGYPGQSGHPEVRAAVDHAIASIERAGKASGIFMLDETLAREYIDKGCTFVAVGADAVILSKAVDSLRARFPSDPA